MRQPGACGNPGRCNDATGKQRSSPRGINVGRYWITWSVDGVSATSTRARSTKSNRPYAEARAAACIENGAVGTEVHPDGHRLDEDMTPLILIIAAVQTGVIGAVSLLAAPTVFHALEAESAGRYLRRLFPRYFASAAILAALGALAAAVGGRMVAAVLLAANVLCFVVALKLVPAINAARDNGDPRFRRLHGASVALNGVGLLLVIATLAILAVMG